jgi:Flp pilus assembly protein TadG
MKLAFKRGARHLCGRRFQRGQGMVEYAVIATVLVGALFVPVDLFGGKTGAQFLADAVRAFFRNLTYFISLP